jgi:hypothetical protein
MSAQNPGIPKITYELPTNAHAFAVHDAYTNIGVFRDAETPEQQAVLDLWAGVAPVAGEGYPPRTNPKLIGTADELLETAALLREWGEPNTVTSEEIDGRMSKNRRASTIALKTHLSRLAVDMASELELLAGNGRRLFQPLGAVSLENKIIGAHSMLSEEVTTLSDEDIANFFNGQAGAA